VTNAHTRKKIINVGHKHWTNVMHKSKLTTRNPKHIQCKSADAEQKPVLQERKYSKKIVQNMAYKHLY